MQNQPGAGISDTLRGPRKKKKWNKIGFKHYIILSGGGFFIYYYVRIEVNKVLYVLHQIPRSSYIYVRYQLLYATQWEFIDPIFDTHQIYSHLHKKFVLQASKLHLYA